MSESGFVKSSVFHKGLVAVGIVALGVAGMQTPAEAQWQELFNGRDLTGWTSFGPGEWTVEDGELVGRGVPGRHGMAWIITEKHFENFQVTCDFKAPGALNSGFTIRYQGDGSQDPAFYGYELQIWNSLRGPDQSGSIYKVARAFWKTIDPDGWNSFDVTADGDHIVVKINGEKVSEVHDRRSLRGALGFQVHDPDTEIRVRNVRLRELPATPNLGPMIEDWMRHSNKARFRSLFNGENFEGWFQVGEGDWTIRNGIVTGTRPGPKGGWLATQQGYKNFYLRLKFRIAHTHNSGVWIRFDDGGARGDVDVTPTLENSIECNIYEHEDPNFANPTGAIANIARSYAGHVDYDDWNLYEVFAFDDHVCVYLNGEKAADGHVPGPVKSGPILLQVGRTIPDGLSSTVQFKDIAIKDFGRVAAFGQ